MKRVLSSNCLQAKADQHLGVRNHIQLASHLSGPLPGQKVASYSYDRALHA